MTDISHTQHQFKQNTAYCTTLYQTNPQRTAQKLIVAVVVKRVLADYQTCILSTCIVIPNSLYLQMTKTWLEAYSHIWLPPCLKHSHCSKRARTHGSIRQWIRWSMWEDAVQMWTSVVNSTQNKSRTYVALKHKYLCKWSSEQHMLSLLACCTSFQSS